MQRRYLFPLAKEYEPLVLIDTKNSKLVFCSRYAILPRKNEIL